MFHVDIENVVVELEVPDRIDNVVVFPLGQALPLPYLRYGLAWLGRPLSHPKCGAGLNDVII
jgi:hypothetical protein